MPEAARLGKVHERGPLLRQAAAACSARMAVCWQAASPGLACPGGAHSGGLAGGLAGGAHMVVGFELGHVPHACAAAAPGRAAGWGQQQASGEPASGTVKVASCVPSQACGCCKVPCLYTVSASCSLCGVN